MKSDSQYRFEKEALDIALSTGSASVSFTTPGKAVQFRQRCYTFRKWKRETVGDSSPYEMLTIKMLEKGSTTVEIVQRTFEGQITPGAGKPLVEVEERGDPELSPEDLEILGPTLKKVFGEVEI